MRDDNRYEYNMDVSRTLAQRGAGTMTHMGSSLAQYPQEMPLLGSGGMPTSYRGSGYPNVNTKGYYYSMGTELADAYGADGSVDYGLSCPPYQVISSDPVQMPVASSYGTWPTARPKSTTQGGAAGGGGLYLDSDPGYGSYGPASNTSLVHRPAVSVAGDSSPYSFSGFAASLPSAGASSNERLLPTPVSRAVVAAGGSAAPPCYGASKPGHQSPSGVVVGVGSTGIQGSPTSPMSEVTGYASSAYDYATAAATNGARSSQQQQHHHHHHHGGSSAADVYASAGGAETIFGDADRSAGTQGSAVDLSGYTYGAPSPADSSSLRRASSGSGLTSRSTAESSTSSVSFGGGSDGGPPPPPPSSLSLGQGTTTTTTTGGGGGGPTYQHHSSSASSHAGQVHHGHHPHHHHHHHHSSPRHGGQHHQQQQRQRGVVVGSTAYGAGSTSSNGIPGGGNTTAAADSSHRPSVATRR